MPTVGPIETLLVLVYDAFVVGVIGLVSYATFVFIRRVLQGR